MKSFKRLLKPSLIISFSLLINTLSVFLIPIFNIYAEETTCDNIEDQAKKLTCLQKEYDNVQKQRKDLQNKIASENQSQNKLTAQINNITNQISATELEIKSKQLLIEQRNVEINLLSKDINNLKNEMSTTHQEIQKLEQSVISDIGEIYKIVSVDYTEVVFSSESISKNFDNVKYMESLQEENQALVNTLNQKYITLKDYEQILSKKQSEELTKKNEIEVEYGQLNLLQEQLDAQKKNRIALLNESQKREEQYKEALKQLQSQENVLSEKVTALIMDLYKRGQLGAGVAVKKGDIIGFQGHTGCSFGSHLHFEIAKDGKKQNPLNYISSSGGYLKNNDNYYAPIPGALITQYYNSGHLAIDVVSLTPSNQGITYTLTEADVRSRCAFSPDTFVNIAYKNFGDPPWEFKTTGEGTPIRAIADGTIYKSTEYNGGGKYVIIDHGNGLTSLYLHLKD